MSQLVMIVAIALLVGVFAGGAFWVSVDAFQVLGVRLADRREKKRLAAEAKALKEKEEAADGEGEK